MSLELFASSTRNKDRFKVAGINGLLSVEDLWDLNLKQLDSVAVATRRELRSVEESFLDDSKVGDVSLQRRFDVIMFVLNTKKAERDQSRLAAEKQAEKQKLRELLERKRNSALEELSVEEIEKRISEI